MIMNLWLAMAHSGKNVFLDVEAFGLASKIICEKIVFQSLKQN